MLSASLLDLSRLFDGARERYGLKKGSRYMHDKTLKILHINVHGEEHVIDQKWPEFSKFHDHHFSRL